MPKKDSILDSIFPRFGRLIIIGPAEPYIYPSTGKRLSKSLCRCDCGNIIKANNTNIKRYLTKSCGCYKKEKISVLNKTHGMRHSATCLAEWAETFNIKYSTLNRRINHSKWPIEKALTTPIKGK